MTRRRWIADRVEGNRAYLSGDHARHLAQVLRAQPGQEFDIATGRAVRRGRVVEASPTQVIFELGSDIEVSSRVGITLLLSIFKFNRMEWAIEKCTELGVERIIPVVSARTEKHLAMAAGKRAERWRRIVRQAAEQSRQPEVPDVAAPIQLEAALALDAPTKIVLAECHADLSLKQALSGGTSSLALAFGPEGGWTESELSAFRESGWIAATLGETILRAETAAIAALAVVRAELEIL
jgi:16S rRNA (uracil1498-N3)-methyltransferase